MESCAAVQCPHHIRRLHHFILMAVRDGNARTRAESAPGSQSTQFKRTAVLQQQGRWRRRADTSLPLRGRVGTQCRGGVSCRRPPISCGARGGHPHPPRCGDLPPQGGGDFASSPQRGEGARRADEGAVRHRGAGLSSLCSLNLSLPGFSSSRWLRPPHPALRATFSPLGAVAKFCGCDSVSLRAAEVMRCRFGMVASSVSWMR